MTNEFSSMISENLVVAHGDDEAAKTRYRPLRPVDASRPGSCVSGSSGIQRPLAAQERILVLPGISCFDRRLLSFQSELQDACDRIAEPDYDVDGFSRGAVADDFNVKCVSGSMQSPASYKPLDNSLLREELGLRAPDESDLRMTALVFSVLLSGFVPAAVNIPKRSSGGFRRFSHDAQWKYDYMLNKLSRYDDFLKLLTRNDLTALANDFEVVYCTLTQRRTQIDRLGKKRYANDLEYALSGGRSGSRIELDVRARDENLRVIDGFVSKRVRVIDAGPWAINCDLQIVASGHLRYLFEAYPQVFHVNTEEALTTRLRGWHVCCFDVKEFDQSMPQAVLKLFFDQLRERWDSGVIDSAEKLAGAPYAFRPVAPGERAGFVDNPLAPTRVVTAGNRSGHAMTSLIAKVAKTADFFSVLSQMLRVTRGDIISILRGTHDTVLYLNNGDDEVVGFKDPALLKRYKDLIHSKRGLYSSEVELGQGFSGHRLARTVDWRNTPTYSCLPRPNVVLQRLYCPERSIGSAMRRFWQIGVRERIHTLANSDVGAAVLDVHNQLYAKWLEPVAGSLHEILTQGRQFSAQNVYDALVLDDPNRLHYSVNPDDVSPEVLDLITSRFPLSLCEGFVRKYSNF